MYVCMYIYTLYLTHTYIQVAVLGDRFFNKFRCELDLWQVKKKLDQAKTLRSVRY